MDEVKDMLSPLVLVMGVLLVVLGSQHPTIGGLISSIVGVGCIYLWERTPWSLTSELSRVCRRLDMARVDMIYDSRTEKVMVLVLSANDEIRNQLNVEVKEP